MGDEIRPDISEAVQRMGWKVGSKRELRKLPDHLHPNEQVRYLASGTYGNGSGLIVLTSTRIMFIKDGWASGRIEDIPLSKVSSIQWSTGLALGKIIIFASGNKVEILNVQKQAGKSITDAVRDYIAGHHDLLTPAPVPPTPSATTTASHAPATDKIARLKELGELRDAGIIEDHELAAMKAEIMGTAAPINTTPPPPAPPPPAPVHDNLPPKPVSHDHLPPPPAPPPPAPAHGHLPPPPAAEGTPQRH